MPHDPPSDTYPPDSDFHTEGLAEVVAAGDRLASLRALRDRLAAEIDGGVASRDLASLSLRLVDVLTAIEVAEKSAPEEKGTPLDELAKRRASRGADATGRPRSEGGSV